MTHGLKILTVLLTMSSLLNAQTFWRDHQGSVAGDRFGATVAALGDVDLDGMTDYAIAAPENDVGGPSAGVVRVFSGRTEGLIHALFGAAPGDRFGTAICGIGDVNADLFPDFVVGSPQTGNSGHGRADIISGLTGAIIQTVTGDLSGDALGVSLANVGDLDLDGIDDLLVGADQPIALPLSSSPRGYARLYSGQTGAVLDTFVGLGDGDRFGAVVSVLGDFDGDGYSEFGVSALQLPAFTFPIQLPNPGAGYVEIFDGATRVSLAMLVGSTPGDVYGAGLAALGDVDGDMVDDFAIAAPQVDPVGLSPSPGPGYVHVMSGVTFGPMHVIFGLNSGSGFGASIAGGADFNGDGVPDLVVGTPYDDTAATDAGVTVILNPSDGTILGGAFGLHGDRSGSSVAILGDIANDGYADMIIGSPEHFGVGFGSGVARVYIGDGAGGSLGPQATGSLGSEILSVDGSTGGVGRRVKLRAFVPSVIILAQPPTNPLPAPFILDAFIGLAGPDDDVILPFGIGEFCFTPCILAPGGGAVTVANSLVSGGCAPFFGATPTPYVLPIPGLPPGLVLTLQAIVAEVPGAYATSNAVLVEVD